MSDLIPPNVADVITQRVALIAAGRDAEGKPAAYSVKEMLDAARLLPRLTRARNGKPVGEPWIVQTLAQVGEFFDKAEATVKGWRERGMPGESAGNQPGRYDLKEIMLWRDATIGPTGRNKGGNVADESRAEGDRRKSIAEAQMKEMKAGLMRGELFAVDAAARDYVHHATHSRAMLEQIPHRFMTRMPDKCQHCGEPVMTGDMKRQTLEATQRDVEAAIEPVHSWLTERANEPPAIEET